jgi:primosomal protein N' (replication factor Y)
VTLVGVINADTALHLPDFRAAERTFHLITQVAGRTGRGEKGGRVLVQTFDPDHPAIRAASEHDYAAFAQRELPIREALAYPPFASIIRLVVRGSSEAAAKEFAGQLADRLRGTMQEEDVAGRLLGPAPAPLAKLRGKYRYQIQLHGPDGEKLRAAVRRASGERKTPEGVRFIVDVDPLDML